jgi:hypothetical protein
VSDLTDIDWVGQEMIDSPAREVDVTEGFAGVEPAIFAD